MFRVRIARRCRTTKRRAVWPVGWNGHNEEMHGSQEDLRGTELS